MRPRGASAEACRSSRLHIIGVKVSETTADVTTAMVSVSANSRNMRPTRPVMNSSGMNTAISDTVSEIPVKPIWFARRPRERDHGEADFARTAQRGLERVFAVLDVADDVLDHDDGIVDDEARPDRQCHQRKIVERKTAEPLDAEGRVQLERQRDAGDDGG